MAEADGAQETLRALLRDLGELADYLHGRGQNAYQLAQRFLENARREQDAQTRAFDEQQARMLDYQRYIWHEIAGLVEKLQRTYGEAGDLSVGNGHDGARREEGQDGAQETAD